MSPRKVRQVVDLIRNKDIGEALAILQLTPRAASAVVEKVVRSAAANAENNYDMDPDSLYVAECYVDQGPTLKRIRPRARGMADRIMKRTCHVTVVLKEKEE
jgi:large subunit ribosomal protein L22